MRSATRELPSSIHAHIRQSALSDVPLTPHCILFARPPHLHISMALFFFQVVEQTLIDKKQSGPAPLDVYLVRVYWGMYSVLV